MAKKNITNPLLEALKKDKETRIAKGQDYDPQKVEKLSAGPGVDYKGLESSYKQHDIDAFDNYEDYIDDGTLKGGQFSFDRLNKMRAENQSNWEQLGHKTEQIATNIVPQILAGVSSMIDIPGYWDAEHAAQNEIVKWANDVKQWSGQKFGVYRENPDKPMDFGDMAWWIDNGGDLAESVGSFMAQGWGVGAALGGIGKIAQLRKFANAVSGGRGALVGNAVNKLAAATMLNQSEAVMEASQVYSDTMSYWRDKGYTADEAKKKAAIAASTTMNINRANILLNITSAGAFLTPLKYSRNLLTAPGGVLKTLGKVASEGGQEALEESINHVGSKAGMAHGRGEEYTLEKAFKDATSSQGLEAALLGAVGGIAQTGGTDLLKLSKYGPGSGKDENGNRINAYKKEAQEYAKQQQIIEQQRATGVRNSDLLHTVEKAHKFASDLQKAHSEGNEAKVKELTSQMFENQAIEHFKAGTTEVFEEMLRAVGSEEGAQEMGIEPQHIEEAVKHLHELEKIYNNYEMYENTDDIVMNRAKNIRLNKVLEHQQRVQSEGESVFNKSVSDTARNYTVNQDQTILNKKEGKLQSTDTITHKVPMPYSMTEVEQDVEKVINSNGADVKLTDKGSVENNETYRKFIDELVAKDSTHDHIENTQILNDLKSQSSTLDKDLRTLKSKEVQQKAKAENDSNKLENEHLDIANNPKSTISQLEKIKSETKNDKVKGIVEARIEQLKTEQTEKKNAKVEKTEVDKFSKKINKATPEQIESIVTDVQANTNLSQVKKDELIKQLDSRRNELNGEPISEVTQDVVDSNEESHDQEKEAEATVRENQQAVEKNEFVPHDADDDFEKEIDESLKELGEKEAVIGKDGKTVYVFTRAKSGSTRLAYQARGFRQIDNEGLVSREEFEDVLNEINPKLLNPTGLKVGDKISFKVNDDDKTLVYSADSNTKEKITWGERKAQIGNDPAKIAEEMPIQILDENGGVLCYLHDAKWISDENLENTEEEIEKDKQKLIKIRKFILANPTKAVTKINKKGPGVLFKTADNKPITVSDAMKDPNLTMAIVKDDTFIGYGVKGEIKGAVPQQGRTYAIVPFGDKQIAIPLKRSTLSQESVKSIVKAIELYFEQDSENQTVKDILEKQKLNITNLQQLRTYISSFIQVLNLDTNMTDKMNELGVAVGSDNYLFGISGNGIEWGRPTVGTQWLSLEKTPSENVADKIAKLEKHLSKMLTGSNKELISRKNANIQIINEDGSTSTISYKEHLKNSFETNVLSAKVETAEGDKYVYSIQSNIEFDPSFAQVENAQSEINKKVTSNVEAQKADIEVGIPQLLLKIKELKSKSLDSDTFQLLKQIENKVVTEIFKENPNLAIYLITEKKWAINDTGNLTANNKLTQVLKIKYAAAENLLSNYTESSIEYDAELAALEKTTNLENEVGSREEYHEAQDISTLFKKEELPSDFDDIDLSDFPDIDVDYMIDIVDDKQISEVVKDSIEKLLIKGLSPSQQQEVIDYLASSIVADAIKQKDETGTPKFDSIKIFEEKRKQLEQLYKVYTDNKLTVKAEKIKAILDNYSKVKALTGEHLSKIATGRVSEINIDELNDTNDGDLNTTWSDDFSLTMDSKNSVSANLKRFFSFIENVDDNGRAKRSPLGFVEIIPFDKVYNTLHEVLANLPSDYDTIIETLEANTIRFPWLKNVVDKLENASEQVQNEFVSDMTKRGLNMKWISWNKQKDGRYAMVVSDANSNSTQNRLIELWSANIFDPSNPFKLVKESDDGEYVMDPEVVEKMKTISDKWFGKDRVVPNTDELHQWLNGFGIKLSDKALIDLQKGKYINKKTLSYDSLFTGSTGLVKVLATYLKDGKFNENLFKDTAVKSLANLESVYAENVFSNSFRAGNKTIYTFTNNNYLSNRVRSLMEDPALLDELSKLSFNGTSSWLEMLQDDSELGKEFRSQFGYSQLSLEALKKQFTPSVDNRKLNNLNVDEHEVCKLSFFFNGYSSDLINGEKFRKVSFFYPTNSDKTNVFLINTLAREIEMDNDGNVSNDNIQLLYDNVVLPEINRMIANIKANNVKGYNPNLFYLMPTLNEVKIGDEYVRDMIIDSNEASPEVVTALKEELNNVLKALVDEKLEDWKTLGIGITDKKQNIKDSFLDKDYMDKVAKGQGVTYAATDMVFNELIANAEIHKLIIGDIALFYKTKEGFTTQQTLEETYINLGKRLAGDIAPGTEIANSEHNQYYQVFFNDRKLGSNAVLDKATEEYMKSFLSKKDFKKYSEGIEGSDAQEYTTWKEHIFVMKGLGKLTKEEYDRIHNRLSQGLKLSVDDLDLVLQPMKPVYVGNIAEVGNNVDRRLYIKSSSFPLIPELTSGLQIDKIRQAMEKFEDDLQARNIVNKDGTKPTVRASFNTANKVGGITNSIEVFDNNGDVNDIVIKDSNSLLLPRKNFRIQQEVPYDAEKEAVNIGTQEQVMLFNNIHDFDGFEHDGKKMTGSELEKEYTNYYHRLFKYKQEKFMKNRGMIEELVNESDIDNLVDIPDSNVFAQLESMKTEMDQEASGIKKSAIRAKYEEMVGKDALRRAEFINKNFEKIISKFAEAKINIFFDENGETKKCD